MKKLCIYFVFGLLSIPMLTAQTCKDLLQAVQNNEIETVTKLLKTVNPNCSNTSLGQPRYPLGAAAVNGNFEMVKTLIQNKAKASYRYRRDASALMIAAENSHLKIVKYSKIFINFIYKLYIIICLF